MCGLTLTQFDCPRCHKPVTEDDHWVPVGEKHYHKKCFSCISCKKPISLDTKYYVADGDEVRCAAPDACER